MDDGRQNLILVIALLGAGFLMLFGFIFVLLVAIAGIEVDLSAKEGIGVIEIDGIIDESVETLKDIHAFAKNEKVKAIVVRIDSPGGSVGPSQEIHSELMKLRGVKSIVVSMGSMAASGGYYIACGAERIFASPGTITGSIGVIIQTTYLEELMKTIKIEPVIYKSGEFKDTLSPFRKSTDDEKKLIRNMVSDVYEQFLEAVASARGIDKEALRPIADGRILTGRQAKEAGLVDEFGNFRDAVSYASEQAGLGDDPELIYPEKEAFTYLEKLLESAVQGVASAVADAKSPAMEYRLER